MTCLAFIFTEVITFLLSSVLILTWCGIYSFQLTHIFNLKTIQASTLFFSRWLWTKTKQTFSSAWQRTHAFLRFALDAVVFPCLKPDKHLSALDTGCTFTFPYMTSDILSSTALGNRRHFFSLPNGNEEKNKRSLSRNTSYQSKLNSDWYVVFLLILPQICSPNFCHDCFFGRFSSSL